MRPRSVAANAALQSDPETRGSSLGARRCFAAEILCSARFVVPFECVFGLDSVLVFVFAWRFFVDCTQIVRAKQSQSRQQRANQRPTQESKKQRPKVNLRKWNFAACVAPALRLGCSSRRNFNCLRQLRASQVCLCQSMSCKRNVSALRHSFVLR